MTERTPDTAGTDTGADSPPRGQWLRFVPPVAALGTAFVLQVVLITDTVGTALADRYDSTWPYLVGFLLGVSVASCAEGGAAYLMDLYDRHLLARDSVWLLRVAMLVYVAGSGAAIHWWLDQRELPSVISWLLAGMSASALFLWSRGSRWRNRQAMIAAGQLDPALPRLPMAAKVLHPFRWLTTLYLISWEPVSTTAEARARYDAWRTRKTVKASRPDTAGSVAAAEPTDIALTRPEVPATDSPPAPVRLISTAPRRSPKRPPGRANGSEVSMDSLVDTLDRHFPDTLPGRPRAAEVLRSVYGSVSTERAKEAKDRLAARRGAAEVADSPDTDDDREDSPARELIGATA